MNYRRLGRSGVKVSEIGLGSWLTYGFGVGDDIARACIRKAFDLGVNFFDTSDVYNKGGAETTLGRELKPLPRRDVVVATKCFFPIGEGVNDRGLSRKHIFESVHDSLKRLQVDYIDLYQCHRYDSEVEMFEVVRARDDLILQGKILYWGGSEWPAEAIRHAHAVARTLGACPPVSEQPEYSIAARRVETNGVQRACVDCGVGMVTWSPLRQGILSGKYSGGKIPRDSRAGDDNMNRFLKTIDRALADKVDRLRPIADRNGISLSRLALVWLRKRDAVASIITGASRVEQVIENCAATEYDVSPADMAEIDRLFPAADNP